MKKCAKETEEKSKLTREAAQTPGGDERNSKLQALDELNLKSCKRLDEYLEEQ